jgi:hypothetical protein
MNWKEHHYRNRLSFHFLSEHSAAPSRFYNYPRLKASINMPRQSNALPYVCFVREGEPHSNCQNEPFSNDAIHHESKQSKIWIGYRNDLNASYNGGMTFGQVLAQAKANLSNAMKARTNSTQRAQWRDVVKQLQQSKCAFRQATCPGDTCKSGSEELLQMEWISIKSSVTKTEVFVSFSIYNTRIRADSSE